ncbi:hypothetical protein K469DRAFT_716547 [Zopfia rhizophila CBS 207.26]|uniref:DUF985 domain-containing protein n=1 Tax=Zopfia rhizophila CBS 207.26 TaxID=1314779 RepID=A0A6A6DM34_9PEZI|nr:hypothetical protein K469DRAFT_716547 [Zopfia rhizophila CBS 207.26]
MFHLSLLSVAFALLAPHMHVTTAAQPPVPLRRDDSINTRSAQDVIAQLGLVENVEKGYYIQAFEDPDKNSDGRSVSTAIYYLLEGSAGQSYWHRVDTSEVWHYYAGAPLTLSLSNNDGTPVKKKVLGPDIFNGQAPQVVVAKNEWQSARSLGRWTLVGTTVAPGFVESGFELAPPDWQPNGA